MQAQPLHHVQVLFFASIREKLGTGLRLEISALGHTAPQTVGQLCDYLRALSPEHAHALAPAVQVRAALNQTICDLDQALMVGDNGVCEVAFFPPVTGG